MNESSLEALARRATDAPDVRAFHIDGQSITFASLADSVRTVAASLARAGLQPGDRCAVLLPTCLESVVLIYAAQLAGGIPVAVDPGLRPRLRQRRLAMLAPSVVVTTPEVAASLDEAAERPTGIVTTMDRLRRTGGSPVQWRAPAPDAVAYLQLTSGTMGDSRAAAITFKALAAGLEGIRERFDMTPADVMAAWVPIHYAPGLVRYVFGTVHVGCRMHLIPPSALDLSRWLSLLVDTGATITSAPDFAYRLAARVAAGKGMRLPRLRAATNGGERVRATTVQAFEQTLGLNGVVQPSYGLAEATLIVSSGCPGDPLLVDESGTVSCGVALAGLEIRTVNSDGTPSQTGEPGEIQVRGDAVFAGYFNDSSQTASVLRDGWLATGDLGTVDAVGNLYPRMRLRALIKRAGAGLPPRDVEECLEVFDDVVCAAAIGVPHANRSTDDLVVIVETPSDVLSAGAALVERVRDAIIESIGMAPARVYILPPSTLPRTPSGKIARAELAALIDDADFLRRAHVG